MISSHLRFIYLLTYSDTKRALLGGRRRYDVNGLVQTCVSATEIEF